MHLAPIEHLLQLAVGTVSPMRWPICSPFQKGVVMCACFLCSAGNVRSFWQQDSASCIQGIVVQLATELLQSLLLHWQGYIFCVWPCTTGRSQRWCTGRSQRAWSGRSPRLRCCSSDRLCLMISLSPLRRKLLWDMPCSVFLLFINQLLQ